MRTLPATLCDEVLPPEFNLIRAEFAVLLFIQVSLAGGLFCRELDRIHKISFTCATARWRLVITFIFSTFGWGKWQGRIHSGQSENTSINTNRISKKNGSHRSTKRRHLPFHVDGLFVTRKIHRSSTAKFGTGVDPPIIPHRLPNTATRSSLAVKRSRPYRLVASNHRLFLYANQQVTSGAFSFHQWQIQVLRAYLELVTYLDGLH